MDKKNERIDDLPVEADQAGEVKGGLIVQSGLVDPNVRSVVDPNVRSVIDPNVRSLIDPNV